ncbi:MAG: efflux RND transporter permease subunit [Candidatus Moranbacteria bacterium]|nr:efflux RND transporter permease subunit [Candidatus Moranbacteria bacterium]
MNIENKLGLAGKLAKIFIINKELSVITIVALFAWGIFSFVIMPKQYNPEIVAPAFNIVTEFPGASSSEVYELITRPMEDKIRELPKVDKIMSQSKNGGASIVTVQYFIGENLEDAKTEISKKIEGNMDLKPLGANDPIIKSIDPDDVPIITIGITSESLSMESLRALAFDVKDELKLVQGISRVDVKGGLKKELKVSLDESKMSFYGISVSSVLNGISANNLSFRGGEIDGNKLNQEIEVAGDIAGEEDLKKIVVGNLEGKIIYLEDVANIDYGTERIDSFVRFSEKEKDSKNAVYVAVSKIKGTNATRVSGDIENKISELQNSKRISSEVSFEILRNDGRVAGEEVKKLTSNLFASVAIVSFVLFLFLGWRSALVVAIAIPLTLAAVFGVGSLAGQTVNRITLFALILSLGLLVDSATVVVENIFRMIAKDKKRNHEEIAILAVDEVGNGLIMSTLTTVLAFYPMAFVTGMMGPYMGPIPFFVPAALIASTLIAFTINPFLASVLASRKKISEEKKNNFFLNFSETLKKKYRKVLENILDNQKLRKKILILTIILFVISMMLPAVGIVKFRMLPKADKEQFYVYLDLPENISVEETDKISREVESIIFEENEVKSIQSFVGESQVVDFNGLFKGSDSRIGENQATLRVNLTHPENRNTNSEKLVIELRKKLVRETQKYPDLRIKLVEDPPGPPVLSTFLIKIQGNDEAVLKNIALDIENMAFEIDEVVDVDSTLNEKGLSYVYEINKEKANLSGVSSAEIIQTLQAVFSEIPVGLYHENENDEVRKAEREFIVVSFGDEDRDEKKDLDKIFVVSRSSEKIPLSELLVKKDFQNSGTIFSDQRKRTVYVSAEMGERSVTYGAIDGLKKLVQYRLPNGKGELVSWSLFGATYRDEETGETFDILIDGEWKLTLEVFRDLGLAMAVAVFLIYFVLVAQFKSATIPLLVMGTIPLAMIGVLPGFAILGWVNGMYFNATSMIGVIALAGIVVNNAIILLEYIGDLKKENKGIREALLDAGQTRFMPIMLTSATTILGSLTIISDPVWAGLAWAIALGLSLSSFLTLIIFPILYFMFEEKNWEGEK